MKLLLSTLLALCTASMHAQTPTALAPGKKIEDRIGSGEKHLFNANLKSGQFIVLSVMQNGIDLFVEVKDPQGKVIGGYDSPNGKHGAEIVTFTTAGAGNFIFEVRPLDEEKDSGAYTIELLKAEAAATTPDKKIDQMMSAIILPGGAGASVAVAQGDKILFSKGYGMANVEYDIPNSPKTIFHIASISKQFTAFAIAMLADQGKISIDDDIRKYLPEIHDFGKVITIKHLVHHTSGLRDQWNLLALAGWRLDDVITKNQVLNLISNQKELNSAPGEEFNYCNTGYTLMAEIVSRVSGMSFSDWCAQNIFKPLGMNNTLFYDDHEKIVKNRAYSFHESPVGLKKSVLSYANAGATSLFTTTEDLIKWSNNFQKMKVGNAAIMKQMDHRAVLNKGDTSSYAFGQDVNKYKGLVTRSHGGADAGYRSFLVRFPEQGYSIVVLSNLASFNTGKLAYEIADLYLKPFLKEEKPATKRPDNAVPAVVVSEELLKLYSGQYQMTTGMVVNFKIDNGKFVVQPANQPPFALEARSDNEFFISAIGATISFERDNNNAVNQFTFAQGGQKITASRLKDFDKEKIDLSKYAGEYYSPELETSYHIVVKDKGLIAKHIRHDPTTLTLISPDTFSGDAWYMGTIVFDTDSQGKVKGMKVSSGRVKNVKFERR